jgi:cytidine deaminase
MLSEDARRQLILAAIDARRRSHAPYSQFAVGAAILAKSGAIFTGVNIENASYGLTICAERAAVFNAVTQGELAFDAIAVATSGQATPCGACRQVLAEFADEMTILLVDADRPDDVRETSLSELLPFRFRHP